MRAFLLALVVLLPSFVQAQSTHHPKGTLVVGTKQAPPFVVDDEQGQLSGISIEMFQRVAKRLGLNYTFQETDLNGLISGLQDETLNLSVAAMTVTAEREKRIDFTHPYHTTGLAIAVPKRGLSGWDVAKRIFSWKFAAALATLCGLLLLVGMLLWLVERRKNAQMFGGSSAQGIGSSFWWAAVTMTTVGYGDKAPVTFWGRMIGLVWMFAAIILISSFTAAISSSLTVGQLSSVVSGPQDLPNVRVVSVAGSSSAQYLQNRAIGFVSKNSLDQALQAMEQGEFDALVYDAPILRYFVLSDYSSELEILPQTFVRQDYAMAVPHGSALREVLNQAILEELKDDGWRDVLSGYLGDEE